MSIGFVKYISDGRKAPRKIVNFIAGIGIALCALSLYAGAQTPLTTRVDPSYEVVVQKNLFVPVRDGVRLAVDLYQPGRAGNPIKERFPTLLVRTPYDKSGASS